MSRSEQERDRASILDMLAAAQECLRYVQSVDFTAFSADGMRVRAVERTLEIIGEAARRLTEELRAKYSTIPWRQIAGQRNFIAHGYEHVTTDRLWRVATIELPLLVPQLEEIARELADRI